MLLLIKNPLDSARDIRDSSFIPGSGRSPGRGHGNPFRYSCLENPMDRGAWRAAVHGAAKCGTRLKQLSTLCTLHFTFQPQCRLRWDVGDLCFSWCSQRILPSPSVGFTKRLLRGLQFIWTVCSFILQVNNRVVHRDFSLYNKPVKISLVMESTLTKFVYF